MVSILYRSVRGVLYDLTEVAITTTPIESDSSVDHIIEEEKIKAFIYYTEVRG